MPSPTIYIVETTKKELPPVPVFIPIQKNIACLAWFCGWDGFKIGIEPAVSVVFFIRLPVPVLTSVYVTRSKKHT